MRRMKKPKEDADLNITSFMNLMIVLVPVLLLNMVFTQTMVLDIKLPAAATPQPPNQDKNKLVFDYELMVFEDGFLFNMNKAPVCRFPKVDGKHNFKGLSKALRNYKMFAEQKMNENRPETEEYKPKKDILLLLSEKESYQTIVSVMDTLRSYPTVVAATVEHAELLPDVSLGDLPEGSQEAFSAIDVEGCVQ